MPSPNRNHNYQARPAQGVKLLKYPLLKQGFIDLRNTYGATPRSQNWAAYNALLSNDRSFAREIFAELKNEDADLQIWRTQQAFDGAKLFSEAK